MRIASIVAGLLAGLLVTTAGAGPMPRSLSDFVDGKPVTEAASIAAEMLSPVVQVNRTCSGSVVRSDKDADGKVTTLVLTAKHCAKDLDLGQEIYVPTYRGNRLVREALYKARIKSTYLAHDLALLELLDTETQLPTVRLADKDVEVAEGEDVWVVGWSLGKTRVVTKGIFGNRESIPFPNPAKELEYYRASAPIVGGNSGGALFHKAADGHFEQIGVTSAGATAANFVNYFVPADAIQTYLAAPAGTKAPRLKLSAFSAFLQTVEAE